MSWHYSLPSIDVVLISDSSYRGQIVYSNLPNIMVVAIKVHVLLRMYVVSTWMHDNRELE